jgi:hypothetical protein
VGPDAQAYAFSVPDERLRAAIESHPDWAGIAAHTLDLSKHCANAAPVQLGKA